MLPTDERTRPLWMGVTGVTATGGGWFMSHLDTITRVGQALSVYVGLAIGLITLWFMVFPRKRK